MAWAGAWELAESAVLEAEAAAMPGEPRVAAVVGPVADVPAAEGPLPDHAVRRISDIQNNSEGLRLRTAGRSR